MSQDVSFLRTIDVARAVGVHPNTVRLYEEWGFLPPVSRAPNGYRLYTPTHVTQMRLARLALHGAWPGAYIRQSALTLVRLAAAGDLEAALAQAQAHLGLVQQEQAQAEAAAQFLQRWARGDTDQDSEEMADLSTSQAARLLGLSVDMLRNWERNGLIHVPRHPKSGYRRYGSAEIGRLRLIRILLRAGYSMMAILRMLIEFDRGRREDLRQVLDTPRPDDEVYMAFDHWLTTLSVQEQRACRLIEMLQARSDGVG